MTDRFALRGATLFDGETWHRQSALIVADAEVAAIVSEAALPAGIATVDTGGGLLVPGFVDLQVNGGGGIQFNDRPDVDAIRTLCGAHARFGTTALLATLITGTPEVTRAALAAGAAACRERVPGFLGLHLEGPHLDARRKGAHEAALIRPMGDADEAQLMAARNSLPVLLVTVAPEAVEPRRITALTRAGVLVSLGHSDTPYRAAAKCAAAGARMVTHLFNAMSPITAREPGLVGAALDIGTLNAGLIADGIHVDPANLRIALRAKNGPGRLFLVTDAMATLGTGMDAFTLNGRTVRRQGGRLVLDDGTLAGADLDMLSAVRFMHREIGLELGEALRMASLYPARAAGVDARHGRLAAGTRADVVHLSQALEIRSVWIGGQRAVEKGQGTPFSTPG